MQYTPRPWEPQDVHGAICVYHERQLVAIIPKTTPSDETVIGDAYLIAAAPDLLEACKEAETCILLTTPRSRSESQMHDKALNRLRAAIAKAEGE